LIEAYGGADRIPDELTSIRPNFIEQLRKGLDLEASEEEEAEPSPPPMKPVR
jgi:hypothetical protein